MYSMSVSEQTCPALLCRMANLSRDPDIGFIAGFCGPPPYNGYSLRSNQSAQRSFTVSDHRSQHVCLDWCCLCAADRPRSFALSTEVTPNSPDFSGLGLAEPILRAIEDAGYTTPTPIHAQANPQGLSRGATCWPARKPVPARPPDLPCRSCTCYKPIRKRCGPASRAA